MNLWNMFPDWLLEVEGILNMPLLILPSYLVCLFCFFRIKKGQYEGLAFVSFLLLSVLTTSLMWLTIGPQIGKVILPLLLLSNILLPLIFLSMGLRKINAFSVSLWGFASLAGFIHTISWAVWFMALAGS